MLATILAGALLQPSPDLTLPRIDIAPALRATDCADAGQRETLTAEMERVMGAARPAIDEMNRLLQRRLERRSARLIELGVWSNDDRARFSLDLLERPDFRAYMDEGLVVMRAMMTSLETVASERASEPERCAAMLRMIASLDSAISVAETGWRAIDAAFADEARRLGVSLD
jgi:phytoene dehydrogenase-like protein